MTVDTKFWCWLIKDKEVTYRDDCCYCPQIYHCPILGNLKASEERIIHVEQKMKKGKMTGRDKINRMSNEKLANHLAECCYCHEYGSEYYLCDGYDNGYCNKCILNALESEIED